MEETSGNEDFDQEFVGMTAPPDGARYQVIRCEWQLDASPRPLRRILEIRLLPAGSNET